MENFSEVARLLREGDGCIQLDVEDDGIGFDPTISPGNLQRDDKLGLMGIQERARILGADLEIQMEPGRGCRVSVRGTIERMETNV